MDFYFFEKKFEGIQSKLKSIQTEIVNNVEKITFSIDNVFNSENQKEIINNKRAQFLKNIVENERHAFNKLNNKKSWIYYDRHTRELDYLMIFVCSLSQLNYKNDLKLYRKMYYYHLCDFSRHLNLPDEFHSVKKFLVLDQNKFLVYDSNKKNELILLDNNFNILKQIKIGQDYKCFQICKNGNKLVMNLVTHLRRKTFVYVFDFNLNKIRCKQFRNQFLFIKSSQNIFFFRASDLHTFYLQYDLNLELVGKLDINNKARMRIGDLNSILNHENKLVFNCPDSKEIRILSKKSLEQVATISTQGFAQYKIFVDAELKIYVFFKLTVANNEQDAFHLYCYNSNGVLMFKQSPIFTDYFGVFKNYENLYLFDNNFKLKSFF